MRNARSQLSQNETSVRCHNTCEFRFALLIISFSLISSASAQTLIHKCTGADGGVEYSQLPCISEKPAEPENVKPDPVVESDTKMPAEEDLPIAELREEESEVATSKSACKKHYRDAIDAIDAEILREFSPDKAAEYKQRLLILTRKLRQC